MCDNRSPEELGIDLNEYPVKPFPERVIDQDDIPNLEKGLYWQLHIHNSTCCAAWVIVNGEGAFWYLSPGYGVPDNWVELWHKRYDLKKESKENGKE
jgi:hypothetical protein